ncbi:MAG: hypothetical protein VXA61_01260 [Candidatus Neomarinimicrobiota bacterium]
MKIKSIYFIIFFLSSTSFAQGKWHDGNLKGINDLFFSLNIKGIDDGVWEKRVFSFIELRLLEHGIELIQDQMPRMVIDIQILDSRVEETSTYLVMCSVYNYGVSEKEYYRSMADTLITRKLMTSKVYSQELIGQTSSKKIHKEVEKSINKILTTYLDQWYRDNPLKQF